MHVDNNGYRMFPKPTFQKFWVECCVDHGQSQKDYGQGFCRHIHTQTCSDLNLI